MTRAIYVLPLLLLLLTSHVAAIEKKDSGTLLTMKDILSIKNIQEVKISRDGARIVFTVTESDFDESSIVSHLYTLKDGRAFRLTTGKEGEKEPKWSSDGRWIAFLSDRPGEKSGEECTQLWVLPASGGEARQLTDEKEDVTDFDWMPDGRSLLYLAGESFTEPLKSFREKEKEKKIDGTVEDREKHNIAIHKVETESGDVSILHHGDYGIEEIRVSPDGKWAAFTSNRTGDPDDEALRDIWLLSLDKKTVRVLTTREGRESEIAWSPDSRTVAFSGYSMPLLDFSRKDIFLADISTGAVKDLTGPSDISVLEYCWPRQGSGIYWSGEKGVYTPIYRTSVSDGTVTMVTSPAVNCGNFDVDVSGFGLRVIAVNEDGKSAPELCELSGKTLKPLTDLNAWMKDKKTARQDVVRWKAGDGKEIEGVLTYPVDYKEGKRYPLIVVVHGGPYGRAVNTLQDRDNQPLAASGYAVFVPNYRGSAGYGEAFSTEIRGDIMKKEFSDVMSGIDSLISKGTADPERLGITGGSYGGYMTNWAVTQTDRFKAGVSLYGIFSLIGDMCNSKIPTFEKDYIGGWYWEAPELYLKSSPFYHAAKINTPVLILHGDDDDNTFLSNSQELYTTLKKMGKTVEFVHYPREGHGFYEPNHLLDAFYRTKEWFDRFVKKERAAYRLGEPVENQGKTLRVLSVENVDDYCGITARGRFIEVRAMIEDTGRNDSEMVVTIAGNSGSEITLRHGDGIIYPAGVPVKMEGEKVLLRGERSRIAIQNVNDEPKKALPFSAAFDLPDSVHSFELRVKDFPPLWIEMP
ncbi:MAG: prolyl oligopeptidase family serine peptidase [Vulcanimicrobiota bacterium]